MKIQIDKKISFNNKSRPLLIAEISANHCGSKKSFLSHILSAKKNGADMVKIQTYEAEDMTIKENFVIDNGTWKKSNLLKLYQKAQTPFDWHFDAFKLAKKLKIPLFSTPFNIRALNFLKKFRPKLYKLASFEITDVNLIKEIAKTKKPIIISTGMANMKEIKRALKIVKSYHNKMILLHCISGYPTPKDEINLNQINFLKKNLNLNFIGISDHTNDIEAASLASTMGISAIEKHFIIKKNRNSPDNSFSITPKQLKELKKNIINFNSMMGRNKLVRPNSEKPSKIFRRSVYAIKDIKKGEVFSKNNIACFRPKIGIGAEFYFKIIGKKAKKNIKAKVPILKNFF